MNALEKLGWKNTTHNNVSSTYEKGGSIIKITHSFVYKYSSVSKLMRPFTQDELLACVEIIKEMENKK